MNPDSIIFGEESERKYDDLDRASVDVLKVLSIILTIRTEY